MMRRVCASASFVLVSIVLACCTCSATSLREADRLYEKKTFEEALREYTLVFEEATSPAAKWKAFYRICGCLTRLHRNGEAAQELLSTPLPDDTPSRARILLLRAEALAVFASRYAHVTQQDRMQLQDSLDVFSLTSQDLEAEIRKTHSLIWEMRSDLVRMPLEKEEYYINVEKIDRGMYPTLFDYAIATAVGFLCRYPWYGVEDKTELPPANMLLVEDFVRSVDFRDTSPLLSAALMEEASRFAPDGRLEASERLKVKRVLLPLERTSLFDMRSVAQDTTLRDTLDDREYRRRAAETLVEWMRSFRSKGGRADAGYQAAVLLDRIGQYSRTVELCKRVETDGRGTYASRQAKALRLRIEQPQLSLETQTSLVHEVRPFTLKTRNLKKVYFRAYPIDPFELRKSFLTSQYHGYGAWSKILMRPDQEWVEVFLRRSGVFEQWTVEIPDTGSYETVTTDFEPPELGTGIYLVVASADAHFEPRASFMTMCFTNVTDFVLVGTSGPTTLTQDAYYEHLDNKGPATIEDKVLHYYTFDARTGKPLEGITLNLGRTNPGDSMSPDIILSTDAEGYASLTRSLRVSPGSHNYISPEPLAQRGESFAYLRAGIGASYSPPHPVQVFVETDRPIYRPADTVRVKVQAVKRSHYAYKTLDSTYSVTLSASDVNRGVLFRDTIRLNQFGSGSTSFQIPQGRLLGSYRLEAGCSGARSQVRFTVEEYKRPEFEVVLEPPDSAWMYGRPAKISGAVKYYFGRSVPDAPVKYTIRRSWYVPFYYRYYRDNYGYAPGAEEVAAGETTTDSAGSFEISFTPEPSSRLEYAGRVPDISDFLVRVESRDPGGRTIEAIRSYRAGKSGIYLTVEPNKGFYGERDRIEIEVKRLTVNETPLRGRSSYQVFRIADSTPKFLSTRFYQLGVTVIDHRWSPIPSLEVQFQDVENVDLVAEGAVEHDSSGCGVITIPPLSQGAYRMTVESQDPRGNLAMQDRILVVVKGTGEPVTLQATSVTLCEKDEYRVGDVAQFIIGSALGTGTYQLEVWAGQFLKERTLLEGDEPIRIVSVPVTEDLKSGFTLRWFGVKDMNVLDGQVSVSVPFSEKKLEVALSPFDKELRPGQKATWGLKVTDSRGEPVVAEALALMYDRSLEYYARTQRPWLTALYAPRPGPHSGYHSVFNPFSTGTRDNAFWTDIEKILGSPPAHPFPRDFIHIRGGRGGEVLYEGGYYALSVAGEVGLTETSAVIDPVAATERIAARKEFAHTAFFMPHLTTGSDGRATFSFRVPDQVTSWKTKAFVFTQDVKEGSLSTEAETKKELMVRLDLPRFFREKDEGTITVLVHNETDARVHGDFYLRVTGDGKPANARFRLPDGRQRFEAAPRGFASFSHKMSIPPGIDDYTIRAIATTARHSDAEERTLPILPSRERLVETAHAALSGDTAEVLKFQAREDKTRLNESMVLQIDPQIALSILNAIPLLVDYPCCTVPCWVNRYVTLGIINQIYRDYPVVSEAVQKIPKRKTVVPAWEEDDPNRLIEFLETPWVWQSQGRPGCRPLLDIFNPDLVEKHRESALNSIRFAQLRSGAFPWKPGGPPDLYVTLYVLAGFAEARRYGVELPRGIIGSALRYVSSTIPSHLKPEERSLSFVSYAAYVVTSYSPRDFSEAERAFKAARSWAGFLEDHIDLLPPLPKAQLAYVYKRLGDLEKARGLLDMATDGAREDPITGVYWTPEKYSWVWYCDTVEKHAFFLRALQEFRPDDSRIPGMVKWLLFNRKGNVWKSTKASAAAVYSLLDYMNRIGALTADEVFKIKWGTKSDSRTVKADDWLAEPIRWQATGEEIAPDRTSATIEKKGPGLAFASITWIYSTDMLPEASTPGLLQITRAFFRRTKEGDVFNLEPIEPGGVVRVGDQIEVQLKINTRSQFEYMHLKDPKAAGFESEALLSGWRRDRLWFYEEPRGSLQNFFLSWIPHGEYVLRHRLRPTKAGTFRIGAATLQSVYSPDMAAHSSGFIITVTE